MKKNKYLIIIIIACMAIAGCKKRNKTDIPEKKPEPCAITTETYLGTNMSTETRLLDENGRPVKITVTSDYTLVLNYKYEPNKITITTIPGNNTGYYEITLSNGRATRITTIGTPNYQELSYNADGYLSAVKTYSGNTIQTNLSLSYTNGNLTEIKSLDAANNPINGSYSTVQYSSDLYSPRIVEMNPLNGMIYMNGITEFLGKLSKNAVINYTAFSKNTTRRFETVKTYSYAKDGNGKFITASSASYTNIYNISDNQFIGTSGGILNYNYRFSSGCD